MTVTEGIEVKVTDLAFSRSIGLVSAPPGAEHFLELPFVPLVQNHLGTGHAAAQFALAEAASAECLQRRYATALGSVFAVVRSAEIRYRKPATGDLLAYGCPDEATARDLVRDVKEKGRAQAVILIDLKDRAGTLTFHGKFDWFISLVPPPPA